LARGRAGAYNGLSAGPPLKGTKPLFGIGFPELLVVLVIILIVFGVGRLPQIGEGLGKAIRGFKKGVEEPDEEKPGDKKNSSDLKH